MEFTRGWKAPPLAGRLSKRAETLLRERVQSYQSRAAQDTERMFAEAATLRRGTRGRAAPMTAVGLVTLGFLVSMVYQNVLAVNFTTGNNEFKIYSNYLDAQQAAGFLAASAKGGSEGVAELGIREARLDGLCVIAKDNLLGGLALRITAGQSIPAAAYQGTATPATLGVSVRGADADGPDAGTLIGDSPDEKRGALTGGSLTNSIAATNLFMNSKSLGGYGNYISGLNLGQSAESVEASAGVDIAQTPVPGTSVSTPSSSTLLVSTVPAMASTWRVPSPCPSSRSPSCPRPGAPIPSRASRKPTVEHDDVRECARS